MNVTPTEIPDVLVLEPSLFSDARGFFMETWHRRRFAEGEPRCARQGQAGARGGEDF